MKRKQNLTVYGRIYQHLFDEKENTNLSANDYAVKQRVQTVFIKKIDLPTITDKEMVNIIMSTFGVSMQTAYNDINGVETIFGDMRKANKEFIRMMVTETQKLIINIEKHRIAINQNEMQSWDKIIDTIIENQKPDEELILPKRPEVYSTRDLTNAISVLAKANNLDKEDPNMPNWEDLQPPVIEPTNDVTVMDLERVPDTTVQLLKQKYLGKMAEIQEAQEVK